jgi:hypothetical protein
LTLDELNESKVSNDTLGKYVDPAIKINGEGSMAVFFNIQPTQSLSLLPGVQAVFEKAVQTAADIAYVKIKSDGAKTWTFKKGKDKYWLVQSDKDYSASIKKDKFGTDIKSDLNTVAKLIKAFKEI